MNVYKKPKFNKKDLKYNPLTLTLEILVREISEDDTYKIIEGISVPYTNEFEYTPYTKLYAKAAHRKVIFNLTSKARSLFLWLSYSIKHGEDFLWINRKMYMEESITSYDTYKKALNELMDYAIVCPATIKGVYWINPEYFFKGSRTNKYPNKLKQI